MKSTRRWLDNWGFLCLLLESMGQRKRVISVSANGLWCFSIVQCLSDNLFWLISTNCTHLPLSFPLNCKGKKGVGEVCLKQYWQIGLCSHFELWSTKPDVKMCSFWNHTSLIFTSSMGALLYLAYKLACVLYQLATSFSQIIRNCLLWFQHKTMCSDN